MKIKNNLLKLIIIIDLILTISPSYSELVSTYYLNSPVIKNLIPKIDKSSLVLININDTTIKPQSKMFNYGSPYRSFINELNAAAKYNSNANEVIAKLIVQRQIVLLEQGGGQLL